MQNYKISANNKFSILTKLMKNQKTSIIPPLLQIGEVINDHKTQSELFKHHFISKPTVPGSDDPVPILEPNHDINTPLSVINISPIEASKV